NKGTGLGLSLVHNYIKEMKGEITVESKEGFGTNFKIRVPINREKRVFKANKKTIRTKLSGRALIVDDEGSIVNFLEIILKKFGLNVFSAPNGLIGYQMVCEAKEGYDLIISDMKMPVMDGPTLLKKVRGNQEINRPNFVFITGDINTSVESIKNDLNLTIEGLVSKPFNEEKIYSVISQILNHSQSNLL
ncbi:hybrid sensor histidine kinase/response regulator, partial [bacterium]|nr:hybrid sensor histidine kinase/response regulator [bacterium]